VTALALAAALLLSVPFLFVLARRPVLRRLALRNAARRPREALLVVVGSMMGAAIITGSLVVGDTLDASVRQIARSHLGPVDELVLAADRGEWLELDGRLASLPSGSVDGMLPVATLDIAATSVGRRPPRAAPRSQVVGLDFVAARRFGDDPRSTGISGRTPPLWRAAITTDLAAALAVQPGDAIDVLAYGRRHRLTVYRVLPRRGVADLWLGFEAEARNVLVGPVTFDRLVAPSRSRHAERFAPPGWAVAVSNRGGVEGGAGLTDAVKGEIVARTADLEAQV